MRPILLLAASIISLAYILPAHADSLFDEKPSCDPYDFSCRSNSKPRFGNDNDGEKKQDKPKSDNPEETSGPRGYLDPPKKSSSIGDSIREQLKPR